MAQHQKPSPQTQQEAQRIARANQKPGQTKEQTQLIAQGIQKGIDEYKKQQKAKARDLSKFKKQQAKAKQRAETDAPDEPQDEENLVVITRQHPLPWVLLALSWLGMLGWLWQSAS